MKPLLACLLLGVATMAEDTYTRALEADLPAWSVSMSPEYYRGEGQRGGVEIVDDAERDEVIRCRFGFADAKKSEPVFLTRKLDPQPPRLDVLAVRFWAKLSAPLIDPKGGLILRLRTSDTAHDNWNVQELLGKPFPVGQWVHVEVDTRPGPNTRNIWGKVFGNIREMTFRLDDIDDQNGTAELCIDDIELVLSRPPEDETYTPTIAERPQGNTPRVLLLHHAAAGHYRLPEAFRAVAPNASIDAYPFRGRHFEFFGVPTDFLKYDAIVLLDIDPFVLTAAQATGIADAVASGTSLLCFGGTVSFCDAKALPNPLRAALPVTFQLGDPAATAVVSPVAGESHPLNQGFAPAWLGQVARCQPLVPKPGTATPWLAGKQPLVAAGTFHQGRTVVVNAQCQYLRLGENDFFASPLGDDFMRCLAAYALHREPGQGILSLHLEPVPVGGGTITGNVVGGPALQVFFDGNPVTIADGKFSLDLPTPREAQETHRLRIEARAGKQVTDWRDVPLIVRHPLDFQVNWTRNCFTFEPTGRIEFGLALQAHDVPEVQAGPGVTVRYRNRWPVTVDSFADIWLVREGKTYHNQAGPSEVETVAESGIRPAYRVSGIARAARPGDNTTYAADDRILNCRRSVRCLAQGQVAIETDYEVRQDLEVQRLPLTVSLPAEDYAGLSYRLQTGDSVSEGRFPAEPQKQPLFDVRGAVLEITTPDGPIRIAVTDPNLRVWCQDLRQYQMNAFRLEIEAPLAKGTVKSGATYRIPLLIQGPVPGTATSSPESGDIHFTAELRNPKTGESWPIPANSDGTHFATTLPGLSPGRYQLMATASSAAGPLVSTSADCFVVEPLPASGFYPLMCYVDLAVDGHCLDPEGVVECLTDIRDAGFNAAAISGPTTLASETPSPGRDLRAFAASQAAQLGLALTFEYSNFTTFRSNATPTPCPFTPEGKQAIHDHLAPLLDIANRTPRLLTAKVIDEPHLGLDHVSWDCPHCLAEFQRVYRLDMLTARDSEEPYAKWARADFAGHLVGEVFRLGAEDKAANATGSWQLLLTYMATGLGYQNPQKVVQDALDWSRYAGWVDFDIYPYFYPESQHLRMVQAAYGMSYMREVARARRVPWGFYVELDDRNWPFQQNPKEASAECAFTAVAHGADYLNTFIHRLASTGCGARPERWELAQQAFREINRLGPTLASSPAVRSQLAILHPNADEKIRNGYARPDHTLELLKGVFGDLDVLPEQVVRESGTIPYQSLLLLDAEFLHEDTVAPLQQWIGNGGILFCDRLPTRTQRGQPIVWTGLGEATPGVGGCHIRSLGKGKVAFLPENPEPTLQALVEAASPDSAAVARQVHQLADTIEAIAGPMPLRVAVRDIAEAPTCVDTVLVGLRSTPKGSLLIAVNHRPVPVEASIDLRDKAWRFRDTLDSPLPFSLKGTVLTLHLAPRGHRVLEGSRR